MRGRAGLETRALVDPIVNRCQLLVQEEPARARYCAKSNDNQLVDSPITIAANPDLMASRNEEASVWKRIACSSSASHARVQVPGKRDHPKETVQTGAQRQYHGSGVTLSFVQSVRRSYNEAWSSRNFYENAGTQAARGSR